MSTPTQNQEESPKDDLAVGATMSDNAPVISPDFAENNKAPWEIQRLANFPRFNPNPVLELSATGKITYFNEATEVMVRELKREMPAQILPPETAAIVRECLASDKPKLRVETQLGSRVISWSFFPVKFTHTVHCYGGDITARKQSEEALRLQHAALDAAANAVVITDQSGDILWVNAAFTTLTGYTAQEVLGKNPRILKSGQHDEAFYRNLWQTISSGQAWKGELTNRRKDGSLYPEEMTITPVRNADGTIARYIAIKQDVSERKRSEEELAEARRLAKYGNWSRDIASGQVTLSDEIYQIFGIEKAKLDHTYGSLLERVEPADREAVIAASFKAITAGTPFDVVCGISLPDGAKRVIREVGHAIRDKDGKVVRLVGTVQDITAQEQAEAELRWKTAFLEAQVHSSLDGILVVNSEGKKILQNQRMLELWKMPPDIAGEIDDRRQLQFAMQKVKNLQAFVEKVEYLYAHPNEVSRDEIELADGAILDRYTSPVADKDGTYYGRIWTFRDVTEQRRGEGLLRQSQKMEVVGQLAGGVAHDFNNMLAVISANAELLLMDSDQFSANANQGLKEIIGATERAANLTRQLLIFSRKQLMQSQPLALNDLVKNMIRMLRRVIPEHILLECSYEKELSFVQADAGMIEQVLLNLAVNARDATPCGGHVRITTEQVVLHEGAAQTNPAARAGTFVCLSVSDTGAGIAPEHLPLIFEPFFTTKEPGKGTGLGLATVHGIVKQHHGWIEVSSQLGQGATFKVFLPAIPAPVTTMEAPAPELLARGGTETILLVEDDFAVRMVTRRMLETYGYRVCEASSGREALEVWDEQGGRSLCCSATS